MKPHRILGALALGFALLAGGCIVAPPYYDGNEYVYPAYGSKAYCDAPYVMGKDGICTSHSSHTTHTTTTNNVVSVSEPYTLEVAPSPIKTTYVSAPVSYSAPVTTYSAPVATYSAPVSYSTPYTYSAPVVTSSYSTSYNACASVRLAAGCTCTNGYNGEPIISCPDAYSRSLCYVPY